MGQYFIVMADVVGSRGFDQSVLAEQLRSLVKKCNSSLRLQILSPFAVTLGDEFQGVVSCLRGVLEIIFWFEEEILKRGLPFKLHYVAHLGAIETPLNSKIAYEMLGPGLTKARSILTNKHRGRPRITFSVFDESLSRLLNDLAYVVAHIVDDWKAKDFPVIVEMIDEPSNAAVAIGAQRDRTSIWRRRTSLRVTEYIRLKRALLEISSLLKGGK